MARRALAGDQAWFLWGLGGVCVGVVDDDHGRWITVPMRGQRMPLRRWLKRGCRTVEDSPTFPTFVRRTGANSLRFAQLG